MKKIMKKRGMILLLSLLVCFGVSVFLVTCSDQSNDGAPGPQIGPNPPNQVFISFVSDNGKYSLEANGNSTLKFTATVTDSTHAGLPGVSVVFDTSLGTFSPASSNTDANGVVTTKLIASCIPGGTLVSAYAVGRITSQTVTFYGDPPSVVVERQSQNVGAAGYEAWDVVQAKFSCSGGAALGTALIDFWSELGCFEHGCNSQIYSDDQGDASIIWYPPMWGTNPTTSTDYNAPRSSVTIATYVENGELTDYFGNTVIYVYPLHAKMWLGITEDPETKKYNLSPLGATSVMVYVYWEDANGRYPQPGITVNFDVQNTTDTNAYTSVSEVTTDSGGYAITYLNGGGTIDENGIIKGYGDVGLDVTIDETGPGNCCLGSTDGWQWGSSKTIDIGGDIPCFAEFSPESMSISGTDGAITCAETIVYVHDDSGPLSNVLVQESFAIDSVQLVNNTSDPCAMIQGGVNNSYTNQGYTTFAVCNGGLRPDTANPGEYIPCDSSESDILWVRIYCSGQILLIPYYVEYN